MYVSKWINVKCSKKPLDGEICSCRTCRLQKCMKLGMDLTKSRGISQSVPYYLGRPEFLMFCDPRPTKCVTFIDIQNLVSEASRLLNSGCEAPIIATNQLEKLSLGAKYLRLDSKEVKFFGRFGRVEFIDLVEFYFLTVIKWIVRFDEFQKLESSFQIKLLNSIWHVFMRYYTCSATASYRKANVNFKPNQKIFRNVCLDKDRVKPDITFISDLPQDLVNVYLHSQRILEDDIIEHLEKLNPTDVELTYMFAQACFEYAGKRFQGEIIEVTDRFQQILSDDLHSYFSHDLIVFQ